ncbi:MAG: thiamine phosphate synthase [Planctomycetes bacterium]|nr:thiamine phosphate synthase [Planctomycetota bacterium]
MHVAPRRLDPSLLRLVVITDGRGDLVRLEQVVAAALDGGARCVQVREPHWSARMLMRACERLLPLVERVRGVLLVNDRLDVAAARMAHGTQIGHKSLPPEVARDVVGIRSLLGYSAHDQQELDAAAVSCDFVLLSPVWATTSKPGLPHLGVARAAQMTALAKVPVVWLGGIGVEQAAQVADLRGIRRPVGIAVRSAVLAAEDPAQAARSLLAALQGGGAAGAPA